MFPRLSDLGRPCCRPGGAPPSLVRQPAGVWRCGSGGSARSDNRLIGGHPTRPCRTGALTQLNAETERRLHAELRLHQAHRLEAVGRLAAGVAHEFNNLLTVVAGSLELIGRSAGLNERIQSLVSQVTRAAERGVGLTLDLLVFTRQQIVQTDTLDANKLLISEFLPELKQSMGETIGLELRLDPDCAPAAPMPRSSRQRFANVAINARHAMQDRGTLTITTRPQILDHAVLADNPDAKPGAFIAVSLTDTGSGMEQEVIASRRTFLHDKGGRKRQRSWTKPGRLGFVGTSAATLQSRAHRGAAAW